MVQVWMPTVTVIGTCRVHDTLRKVQSSGLINLDNGGMNSFVHTLPEILLRLEVMSKSSEYLQDIVDIQVGTRSGVKLRPEETFDIRESDVIVIEISSLKAIFYQNHPLQFNEVNRHLCTPNGEFGIKLRDEINSAFNNGGCKINIPDLPYPESIPQRYKQIITGLQPMLMDEESIHFYLDQVVDFAGKIPIMFVNHINIEGNKGEKISSRDKLCRIVSNYCDVNNLSLYEPADLFKFHDKKYLLAKEGKDLAHYADNALETVGLAQYEKITELNRI
jgi:hypothetical protein